MAKIILKNVSIEYPIYNSSSFSLRHKLVNYVTGGLISKEQNKLTIVKALNNISLELESGDRLGVLGHNGSGKTTLLRTISGILQPNSGTITTEGSISSFIEIGAGMSEELSGYENIYRLLLLRETCSPKKIKEFTQKAAEFSELGEYLNLPVRTYSSGMAMRLMASVAVSCKPEIMVMDEFFSAGDSRFKHKLSHALGQNIENSSILVFASHSTQCLLDNCNKFVSLTNGYLHVVTQEHIETVQ